MYGKQHGTLRYLGALLLSTTLLLGGCATLFSGTDEDVTFRSEPSGADVVMDGIVIGQTDGTIEVDRVALEDADVVVRLEGYEDRRFELDKEFNTVSILNIFVPIGFVIDALTGALFRYDKKEYTVDMETGAVSLRLNELPRGEEGQYIVPNIGEPVIVTDKETGLHVLVK